MAQVDIQVNGRSYTVACDEGQEAQVTRLGQFLDRKVTGLVRGGVGQVGETRLLLLAGLTIADELLDSERALEAARNVPPPEPAVDEGAVAELLDRVSDRIERVAAALEQD